MRYIAAYMLAALGGKESPSEADVRAILGSVGIDVDEARLATVMKNLHGKRIDDVVNEGLAKLASVPAGGAPVAAAVTASKAPTAGAPAPAAEAKAEAKETKKKAEEPAEDEDMGFSLFD